MFLNLLSATWRIYPSSKWSSQWPYDGYIRHGRMTSCGRGRDSATLKCFRRGYRGTIFVRSSKLSPFLPELCPFRRVFCFPRFWTIWRQMFKLWGFWFRRCFGALFENSAPSPGILLRTLTTTTSISWKSPFFFPKQSRFYLPDSYGDPKSEQSTLVMVRRKPEWNLDFRALARSSAEGPSIVVAIGTSRVRWSMVQKRKKKSQGSQRVIVRRLNPSSSTNQRGLRSLFPRPDVATVSHFAVFVDVDVQLQDGQAAARGQRRKAVIRDISVVDHWGVTNLSAPIWFTGQRHCTVFRHVMQLSLLVLCWKSTLTVILPQIKKKDHFQTLATGVPKLKIWLGTQRVKSSFKRRNSSQCLDVWGQVIPQNDGSWKKGLQCTGRPHCWYRKTMTAQMIVWRRTASLRQQASQIHRRELVFYLVE